MATLLPDVPRFVETRAVLLGGRCEVSGLEQGASRPSFVVRDDEFGLISVVGHPDRSVISEVARGCGGWYQLLATPENVARVAGALLGWETSAATLQVLGDEANLPKEPREKVRLLDQSGSLVLDRLPSDLRAELEIVLRRRSPAAATFVGGDPVSFCYAVETENLWDVSVDTLAEHRNRGYAAWCVAYVVEHMRKRGKRPVWGAVETNLPSLELAAKLGFAPVDRIFVLEPARGR